MKSIVAVGCVCFIALSCSAGDLNPPAGPISPTHKTLTEVEPRRIVNSTNTPGDADSLFKITQPGSYYLTANITGVAAKHGIEIIASGVTLDLNGFELIGVSGSLDGITVNATDGLGITIRHGAIRSWGDCGIEFNFLTGHPATAGIISDLHLNLNGRHGLYAESGTIITNCVAAENIGTGIDTSANCTLTNCSAYFNAGDGISTNTHCVVTNCVAASNTGSGFSVALGSTITACTAGNNGVNGFDGQGSTFQACTAYSNDADGFSGLGNLFTHCTAYRSGDDGFAALSNSTVTDCQAYENTGDGIQISTDCRVVNNTCDDNGNSTADAAGIHATSTDNRIEGNTCTDADRGIDIDGTNNFIIRNTCAGNGINWDIVANNVVGPIIDRTATGSAAISGNAAPSSLGSTDANANYTH